MTQMRPLFVPFAHQGAGLHADGYRVVAPGDPEYADAYALALSLAAAGIPMPYADAGEPAPVHEAGGALLLPVRGS